MPRRRLLARIILSGERPRKGVDQLDYSRIKGSHVAFPERARGTGHDQSTSVLVPE